MTNIELSLPGDRFARYVRTVIETTFPDGDPIELSGPLDAALERIAVCFESVVLPGYLRSGTPYLNHLHGDQSAVFWYYLSNSAFQSGQLELAQKCMLINKARNGILVMYDTLLPKRVLLIHTVGTMLGKATYGDYFVATQNVTVGAHKGNAPTFGRGVIIHPRAFVAGDARIGAFSRIAAGATILDLKCDERSILSGSYPDAVVKASSRDAIADYFKIPPP